MVLESLSQVFSLLCGVLLLLVDENHSLKPQLQVTKNDCKATEVEMSLLVNQLAVLRILNESTSSTLHETEMQELMEDLQDFKATTMENMTAAINDLKAKNEKTTKALNELLETVVNVSPQATVMSTMTPPPLECEDSWSEYQSSCYKVFKIGVTHTEATRNCRTHGAYLASIGSEGENSFVHGLIEFITIIGLSDEDQEGVYIWQDGSPFSYFRWRNAHGQPDNWGGNEDCVCIHPDSYWADIPCSSAYHYVCEKRLQ